MSDGPASLTVAAVDGFDEAQFVATFGAIYEDAPELAVRAWSRRPYGDREGLIDAFVAVAGALDRDATLVLLRAHPELGSRRPMAVASTAEQAAAGLDRMDEQLRAQIAADNARYRERFGFPFIIAVRGLGTADVAAALAARLASTPEAELDTARAEVQKIARIRIEQLVAP